MVIVSPPNETRLLCGEGRVRLARLEREGRRRAGEDGNRGGAAIEARRSEGDDGCTGGGFAKVETEARR